MDLALQELKTECESLEIDLSAKGQLFQSAKLISDELLKIKGLVDANNAKDMILGARNLTNLVTAFIANAQKVAEASHTTSIREQFVSTALQVKHFAVQLKMLLAVRAAGSATQQSNSSVEDNQLKTCVKGIVDSVLTVVRSDQVFEDEDPFAGGNWTASTVFSSPKK